jgi:hypothetical protein
MYCLVWFCSRFSGRDYANIAEIFKMPNGSPGYQSGLTKINKKSPHQAFVSSGK